MYQTVTQKDRYYKKWYEYTEQ